MEITLKANTGREGGTRASRRLRRQGQVPAIVYGRGSEPVSVSVDRRELNAALSTEAGKNVLINLEVEGTSEPALTLARELQRDPVRGDLLHVDFVAISRFEAIEANVPVHLVGDSPAVGLGMIIETHAVSVVVSCLPTEVPSALELPLDSMAEVGDSLKAGDIEMPEGVLLVTDQDESIAVVVPPPVVELEEELEGEGVELEGEAGEAGEAEAAPATEGGEGGGEAEG